MRELLSVLLLGLLTASVSALPCCPADNEVTYANESLVCHTGELISLQRWCDTYFMITKDDPEGSEFKENDNRTEFYIGSEWTEQYCTTSLRADAPLEDRPHLKESIAKEFALLCFPAEADVTDHYLLYGVCLVVSCVFLLATLAVYIMLPELRDTQGKCVLCLVLSLMLGYLGLSYLQLPITSPQVEDMSCVSGAFFTYFWMLSAFCWLNLSSFNMWRNSVLAHINVSEDKLVKWYYLIGFGFPFLLLTFALVSHHMPGEHIRPHFGEGSCWFQGKFEQWVFFYGVVLVLLVLNVIYFVSTALFLWSDYRYPHPRPRINTLRAKFCVYFKLFLVMGMTWIFEILSYIADEPWLVTDLLNCLQGTIIFLVMVALRKRVWRGLAARGCCTCTHRGSFAMCWQRMEDDESENEPIEPQQQLASMT